MKKRIISLLLVVAMLLCVLPAASAAEGDPAVTTYYLTLNDSIAINFKVSNWNENTEVTVNGKAANLKSVSDDGVALFSHTDLSPDMIAEKITIAINGTEAKKLSVLGYCEAILAGNYSGTLKRLAADLVNYGIAFHAYKNSTAAAIDAPANTAAYASVNTPALSDETVNTIVGMTAAGASLKDSVELYFDCAGAEKLVITKAGGAAQEVTRKENEEMFYFKLNATEMRKVVTVKAYAAGDVELEGELKTSIEDYAAYCNSEGATDACKAAADVTVAMMKYGDSAEAYVADPTGVPADLPGIMVENFNDGDISDWQGTFANAVVANKSLKATGVTSDGSNNISVNKTFAEQTGVVSFEFDYKTESYGNADFGVVLKGTAMDKDGVWTPSMSLLNFACKNGKFALYDGGVGDQVYSSGTDNITDVDCVEGKTYHIQIIVDSAISCYTLIIDGNTVVDGRFLRYTAENLTGILIDAKPITGKTMTGDETAYFDNIVVKASNAVVAESKMLMRSTDLRQLTAAAVPENSTNGVTSAYANIYDVSAVVEHKQIETIEFKFKVADGANCQGKFYLKPQTGSTTVFNLTFKDGKVYKGHSSTGSITSLPGYKVDQWNTVRIVTDAVDETNLGCKVYINGVLHSTDLTFGSTDWGTRVCLEINNYDKTAASTFEFKDIIIYKAY